MEAEDIQSSGAGFEGPLQCVATQVHNVMADFEDPACHIDPVDVQDMIGQLTEDQLQVFDKVKASIEGQVSADGTNSVELCRLFVSGCGGTGKSFLIQTIRSQKQEKMLLLLLHPLE